MCVCGGGGGKGNIPGKFREKYPSGLREYSICTQELEWTIDSPSRQCYEAQMVNRNKQIKIKFKSCKFCKFAK